MSTALVLAGGGVAGIAWETGLLLGLREGGTDLTHPDLVVGTSAGAAVGAQLLSGTDLEDLFAAQVADEHRELLPEVDLEELLELFSRLGDLTSTPSPAQLQDIGALALSARTVPVPVRRAVIEWRLPNHAWPVEPLRITTVDARTGELVVLDRDSGVPLVDAVSASCAVPGVWPVVPVLGRELMDGGTRSLAHADLAAGHDRVVVLLPQSEPSPAVTAEAVALRVAGASVSLLTADVATTAAMGLNPLDPSCRPAVARAGRTQGRELALSL